LFSCPLVDTGVSVTYSSSPKLVDHASRYGSKIILTIHGKKVNAKSIMGLMMLAASKGTVLELSTDGVDEIEAMKDISELIENRFGEEE